MYKDIMTNLLHNLLSDMFVILRWPVELVRNCTKLNDIKESISSHNQLIISYIKTRKKLNRPDNFHHQIPSLHTNHKHATWRNMKTNYQSQALVIYILHISVIQYITINANKLKLIYLWLNRWWSKLASLILGIKVLILGTCWKFQPELNKINIKKVNIQKNY